MKVVTLLNEKGGVGKTTLATHIAAGLAIRGKRVVLIDADAQGHSTFSFNVPKAPRVYDWLVRNVAWENVLVQVDKTRISTNDHPMKGELYLLPSNHETRLIPMAISNAKAINERLSELKGLIDIVVFDTSPTPSLLHALIYMATTHILFPVMPSALSLDGLMESQAHRENANLERQSQYGMDDIKVSGIIPTMYHQGHNQDDFGLSQLTGRYRNQVWGPLPYRTEWGKASYAKKMIYAHSPEHEAAAHAWAVVERTERSLQ